MLYIDPDTCIDCGLCVDECPVQAIYPEEDLPEEDTPFNPDAFLASSGEVNKARRKLSAGGVEEMSSFGINLADILRQVGTSIGEELAFSLRTIDGDIEFLNEMMDWWEHAGLGELSYGIDPEFHIKAMLVEESESPGSLPLHALDGGIIEGALTARYQGTNGVDVRRDEDPDGSLIYTLEMLE